jgi:Flp pilus assembly protein TadG
MRLLRKIRRDESGAAAVEFAFVAPVAILMMFAVIESGRLMFTQNELKASLSTAAREWMINPDASNSQVQAAFCAHVVLVDCAETTFTITSQTVSGQTWRVMTASTLFNSPLAGLLPLPSSLTQTQRVPIYAS